MPEISLMLSSNHMRKARLKVKTPPSILLDFVCLKRSILTKQ